MSRISFREDGEEHNFWQNYTDLMSGFLIVFIITSLVAYGSYKVYVDLYHNKGITENNINDIVVNLFHEGICCVSAYVDANTYAKYNFENRSSKSMFIQRQMKIFKSLTNGVSAFDYIYGADLR